MSIYPINLQKVIDCLKDLPGIGEKTSERLALSLLELSDKEIKEFSNNLNLCKEKISSCEICGQLTDKTICDICNDENRNQSLICVLEDPKSVFTFEKIGNYNGTYHVLHGLISPIDGIKPEDINLKSLIERCKNLEKAELIIALKSSVEGETTTLYIKKVLEKLDVEISRLSYGIPIGAEIDYLDALTLDRALEDRKKIS